jgi:quercetin dioxygenase-like cupin family protein
MPAGADLWFLNSRARIRVASADAPDGLSVIEHWLPHGAGPPLHVHRNEDEVFHLLAGRLHLRVADRDIEANAGDILVAPKGVPHTYKVLSPEGAHCLTIARGADFEALVRELGRPAEGEGLPPSRGGPPPPELVAMVTEAAARHGIDMVGPPLE